MDIDRNYYGPDGAYVGFADWTYLFDPDCDPRRVALTDERATLGWWVSTVWLGTHSEAYETLVFGSPLDQLRQHYIALPDALEGHDEVVARVRAMAHG